MIEHFYYCPFCMSRVSVLVDPSVTEQTFIEDCERCCNPIEFSVEIRGNEIQRFDLNPVEQ